MAKTMIRQGGRSARIQQAVHDAVRQLLTEVERSSITVPMLAERAGIPPSTIYRRWGDLSEVLADVAAERMRPQADPVDLGNARLDLEAWAEQYAEEMSSAVGRELLKDLFLPKGENIYAVRCCELVRGQLEAIAARSAARGERVFCVDEVIDRVVAPLVYHLLFGDRPVTGDYGHELVATVTTLPPRQT